MPSRIHTIVFVPPSSGPARQFRIGSKALTAVAVAVGLVIAFTGWVTAYQLRSALGISDLQRLQRENEDLRRANGSFEASVARLQLALTDAEDRTRDLAIVAGLEQLAAGERESRPSETGAGGSFTSLSSADSSGLPDLEARASLLDSRLDAVSDAFEQRRLLVRSTPAITPAVGVINSGYGYRRDPFTGQRAFHHGLDIAGEPEAPVMATADGIVVRAERMGSLGRTVSILHRFGYVTRYAHLAKILVEEGQVVERGDVVGQVGHSGRATGYHLHYEVRRNGKARNPFNYLRDRY